VKSNRQFDAHKPVIARAAQVLSVGGHPFFAQPVAYLEVGDHCRARALGDCDRIADMVAVPM
jgi:hypothetical protein